MEEHGNHGSRSRFNILPLLLIGGIIFVMFKMDIKEISESPQLNKNISYIKSYIQTHLDDLKLESKKALVEKFFKPENIDPLSNSSTFSFSKILEMPEVNLMPNDNSQFNTQNEQENQDLLPTINQQ